MSKKGRVDFKEKVINKTILAIFTLVFGILALIGANTHILLGAIFMLFFMACFGSLVSISRIKDWIERIDNLDWWD